MLRMACFAVKGMFRNKGFILYTLQTYKFRSTGHLLHASHDTFGGTGHGLQTARTKGRRTDHILHALHAMLRSADHVSQ